MSDNLRRYCAIHSALLQQYPAEPTGDLARHLRTLAALVSGIVGSKKCHLPAVASKMPDGSSPKGGKRESRAKRFARFLQNKTVTPETFFRPYAQALVGSLPPGPLVLVMDGSVAGRGCLALMVSVLYQQGDRKRALPLCWQVVKAPKGHFPQEKHRELLAQARGLIPAGREVVFLGDGEFDGCGLLEDVAAAGWRFACRTARNVLLAEADRPDETFSPSDLGLQPGDCVEMADVLFTAQGLGLLLVGAEVMRRGWQAVIHRADRCDLSLFQLGLVWLEHCLSEGWTVPTRLQVRV